MADADTLDHAAKVELGKPGATSEATPRKKASRRRLIITIVAALAIVLGGYLGYESYFYVSTDNAMVQAQTTLLSSKISGFITKASVQENEKVKAGQILIEINPADYKDQVDQMSSEQESLAAQVRGADINYRRTLDLFRKGASTQERLDTAEIQLQSLQKKMKAAQAQVNSAQLNFDYTKITAPTDGKVGRKSFEVGMYANAGQPLFGFVEGAERWVVANLKETDLDYVVEGKKATVTVDAISGRTFDGVVESISPTTGATFSLLPPDNATGNFTKVVQRVPVRIKLLNLSEHDIDRLQSGLSAEVSIRVH